MKLFTNEFKGLSLSCDDNLVPQQGVTGHQTCAVRGALPGQTTVPGLQYAEAFGFSASHQWRNIGIMIAIAFIYLIVGVFGSEVMSFVPQGGAPLVFARRRSHMSATTELEDVEKSAPTSQSSSTTGQVNVLSGQIGELALTWKKISVDIGENHILKSISGYVRRGELTALCGASGAGKTTLLTALSQTNFAGQLQGEILVGNQPPSSSYKKTVGKLLITLLRIVAPIADCIRLCSTDGPSRRDSHNSRGF